MLSHEICRFDINKKKMNQSNKFFRKQRGAWKMMRNWLYNKSKDYLISMVGLCNGIEPCADITACHKKC
jgi:hypothetical protein